MKAEKKPIHPTEPSRSDRGWKKHLLSSGVPLEHEISRYLTREGLSWDADFLFSRPTTTGGISEGSVDLSAFCFERFGKTEAAYRISLLIECKYRSNNKSLILLPLTEEHAGTAGGTLTVIDDMSHYHLRSTALSEFEHNFPFAYKGIEVFDGGAIEKEFRHGIEQLRHAAPVLVKSEIDFQLGSHMDDVIPVFTSKILVTNAPLKIVKPRIGLKDIEKADLIDDIADDSDSCILYSQYGPDYPEYVRSIFADDADARASSASYHADQLDFSGKALSRYSDPSRLVRERAMVFGAPRSETSSL